MLHTPISIGTMTLPNRLVMPPMCTYMADADGAVSDKQVDYYRQRAEGGHIGLIIIEHNCVSRQGLAGPGQMSMATDAMIAPAKRLTDAVHACGTKIVLQINHAGSATNDLVTGEPIVSASAVACPGRKKQLDTDTLPRELTVEEIHELEELYVAAALRAKAAGYDGVEIHTAHGYLMNQFYSPLTNLRHDEYGCDSVENRVRFQTETLRKVRAAVGADYPVLIRLGGCDYMDGGSTIEDAVEACRLFQEAGADALDLTGGMCRYTRVGHSEPGYFADMTAAVKQIATVPVILAGGIKTAAQAEEQLLAGSADLIGVGRALMADPRWAEKEMQQ